MVYHDFIEDLMKNHCPTIADRLLLALDFLRLPCLMRFQRGSTRPKRHAAQLFGGSRGRREAMRSRLGSYPDRKVPKLSGMPSMPAEALEHSLKG